MKACIVGCGNISKMHVQALLRNGHTIGALCDIDKSKAAALKEAYGLDCPIYDDYLSMLTQIRPDAVHILTPHYLHADMCIESLRMGVNVLCEKPLCIRSEDIVRIKAAARESEASLGVVLQNRYNNTNLQVKRMLEGQQVIAGFGNVVWKRDAEYYTSSNWKGKWATEGGGALINQALHTLDLMQWYMGVPDYVTAHKHTNRLKGVIEVEDTLSAYFEYKDGRRFDFYCSNCSGAMFPVQIMLATPEHKITLHPDHLIVDSQYRQAEVSGATVGKECWGDGHSKLIGDYYRHLSEGSKFWLDADEGAKVVSMILAAYRSQGERVPILEEN